MTTEGGKTMNSINSNSSQWANTSAKPTLGPPEPSTKHGNASAAPKPTSGEKKS
jgi:hypothetical protein